MFDLLADGVRQRLRTHGIMMCLSEERPSILALDLATASETKQEFQAGAMHADGAIEISNNMLIVSVAGIVHYEGHEGLSRTCKAI